MFPNLFLLEMQPMKPNKPGAATATFLIMLMIASLSAQTVDSREQWANDRQPPGKVMDAIGVKPGMVIGEIGAGRGRYTVHLATRVGDTGKIYANDINERALDYLRQRCRRDHIKNVEIILGKVDDPLLPEAALDMVFMVWVYHMMAEPVAMLKSLHPSLKPGATVVIVDPVPEEVEEEKRQMKGRANITVPTREQVEKDAARAGFQVAEMMEGFLEKDNIFILRKK
jgi:ubiquinone/menaquinone biosynthesis C-methylase UbiE